MSNIHWSSPWVVSYAYEVKTLDDERSYFYDSPNVKVRTKFEDIIELVKKYIFLCTRIISKIITIVYSI